MVQTRAVAAKLATRGIASTILNVTSTGDRERDRSFQTMSAQNVFVTELEEALRDGRAQYAVHSCKDMSSVLPGDMEIAAVSAREDARDMFCSEHYACLEELPQGASVGTSSLRRRAQLHRLRADLRFVDLRGNVDTRLRKLQEGRIDAIVLACAGLNRLHARARHMRAFSVSEMVPATAQGAIAVEVVRGSWLGPLLREAINDDTAERAVRCERAALRVLQGGCRTPIGIHARYEGTALVADGFMARADGKSGRISLRAEAPSVEAAQALGERVAQALMNAE